ncbi:MAG: hypothetical protein MI723_00995 [Caulobacterales bacterium]|nr:hypothetical protein [Caulobacterales bacterium]
MLASRAIIAAPALIALAFPAAAAAADMTGGGTATYATHSSHSSDLPDGSSAVTMHWHTVLVADDETNPFHLNPQGCSGTTIVGPEGDAREGAGFCAAGDADGDLWWLSWESTETGSTWEIIRGTGKFEGMTGGGDTTNLVQLPDGSFVIRWDGSWTMP